MLGEHISSDRCNLVAIYDVRNNERLFSRIRQNCCAQQSDTATITAMESCIPICTPEFDDYYYSCRDFGRTITILRQSFKYKPGLQAHLRFNDYHVVDNNNGTHTVTTQSTERVGSVSRHFYGTDIYSEILTSILERANQRTADGATTIQELCDDSIVARPGIQNLTSDTNSTKQNLSTAHKKLIMPNYVNNTYVNVVHDCHRVCTRAIFSNSHIPSVDETKQYSFDCIQQLAEAQRMHQLAQEKNDSGLATVVQGVTAAIVFVTVVVLSCVGLYHLFPFMRKKCILRKVRAHIRSIDKATKGARRLKREADSEIDIEDAESDENEDVEL